jgi:Ca2+-binding RTX toxin-like protein
LPTSLKKIAPLAGFVALFATLGLLAATVGQAAGKAAGKPTCEGKVATIVSDAAKIVGTKAPDVIVAGAGANTIYGEGGDDTICGGEGNDTIYGGRGDDTIDGEGGDDSVHGERGSDMLEGGDGTDRVYGDSGNDHVDGGAGDHDLVEGDQGDDSLDGGPGDFDLLVGGPGNDGIDGGPGEHDIASYAGTGGAVTIDLASGTVGGAEGEHLSGIEDALGGSGDDTLIGDPASANRLDGGPGNDRIEAAGPGDEAFGGPGEDQCSGSFAAEESCGGEAGGGATAEIYDSIAGTDSLIVTGTPGADDVDVAYAGGNYVVTGTGPGTVTFPGPVDSIVATMGSGNDTVTIAPSVPASVSSTLEGGKGSDTLRGGEGNDVLYAGEDSEPDTLEGGGGDDVLYGVNIFHPRKDSGPAAMLGGPGSDLMVGGQPCDGDSFVGGPGEDDSASFARVQNTGVYVEATIGGAVEDPDVAGCDAGHIDSSTEKIEGSPGPDVLSGDGGPNVLLGRGGDDRLDGAGGDDSCIGGSGSDQATSCETVDSVP